MHTPYLFDSWNGFVRARANDPTTSHAAAASIDLDAAHFMAIMAALVRIGQGTCYDIGKSCGLNHWQVARRLPELEAGGKVRVVITNDGLDVTRKGPTGRQCRVWELK